MCSLQSALPFSTEVEQQLWPLAGQIKAATEDGGSKGDRRKEVGVLGMNGEFKRHGTYRTEKLSEGTATTLTQILVVCPFTLMCISSLNGTFSAEANDL